ncbi:carbohydrate ABC transporter permease [Paenibacillus oenotherae]|uniref:Carbohydrate ABC transporter permease n=1 Tax=Paenibacillus oenotherae TaxID=1435645 RepID=A0ABS7DB43_9BACL|nr:carbohydrate ABC transporter permease [Paenibacillus oenotherae]MBW7477168.1 carbohydrate ABC transporter permease [Paenibacillus oenotherae]
MRKLISTIVMLLFALIMIYPFLWMISTSFKQPFEVFQSPFQWISDQPTLKYHEKVWTGAASFVGYYWNSLKISIISTIGAVFFAAVAAYGFSRIEFKGRDTLFLIYLVAMMIPNQIIFIPKFIMFNSLGLYNTHWALILPGLFTVLGVFMLRQFFIAVPKDISESAMLDGAGHFSIFLRIMLPMAKPSLATLAIIDFSWHWNDFENALIFLLDKNLYTVSLGLQSFVLENSVDYNGMMAAATAGMVPMIIVFLIGQKFIVEGLASSAVKG